MRSIAILLVVAVSAASAEMFCTPGLRFKQDCNSCLCKRDGTGAFCTFMKCPTKTKEEVFDSLPTKNVCKPGEKFELGGITCTCNSEGTNIECSTDNQNFKAKSFDLDSEKPCEYGSIFSPDGCNTCRCGKNGKAVMCTLKLCPFSLPNQLSVVKKTLDLDAEPKQICEPGTHYKDYCNSCVCSKDGLHAACTKMRCDPAVWNADGSMKIKVTKTVNSIVEEKPRQVCTPGKPFKDYCNFCACSSDGTHAACTRMLCNKEIYNKDGTRKDRTITEQTQEQKEAQEHKIVKVLNSQSTGQVCEPRSSFNDYCNRCICSDDGLRFGCTRMFCDKAVWNMDGTLKVEIKQRKGEKVCEPLTTFKEECNTCFCLADGMNKACTLKACLPLQIDDSPKMQ